MDEADAKQVSVRRSTSNIDEAPSSFPARLDGPATHESDGEARPGSYQDWQISRPGGRDGRHDNSAVCAVREEGVGTLEERRGQGEAEQHGCNSVRWVGIKMHKQKQEKSHMHQ